MAFILGGTTLRRPASIEEVNSTQVAQQRTLSGAIGRDYFGSNKRVWTLEYEYTNKTDYDAIYTIYASYLSTGTAKSWSVTETNYAISSTTVHVDLLVRSFNVKGDNYISSFTLTLTET